MPRFYAFMTINNNPTRFHYNCTQRKQWTKTMGKKKTLDGENNTKHKNEADMEDASIIGNDEAVNTLQVMNS